MSLNTSKHRDIITLMTGKMKGGLIVYIGFSIDPMFTLAIQSVSFNLKANQVGYMAATQKLASKRIFHRSKENYCEIHKLDHITLIFLNKMHTGIIMISVLLAKNPLRSSSSNFTQIIQSNLKLLNSLSIHTLVQFWSGYTIPESNAFKPYVQLISKTRSINLW